jgi:hypothetical protein
MTIQAAKGNIEDKGYPANELDTLTGNVKQYFDLNS